MEREKMVLWVLDDDDDGMATISSIGKRYTDGVIYDTRRNDPFALLPRPTG